MILIAQNYFGGDQLVVEGAFWAKGYPNENQKEKQKKAHEGNEIFTETDLGTRKIES